MPSAKLNYNFNEHITAPLKAHTRSQSVITSFYARFKPLSKQTKAQPTNSAMLSGRPYPYLDCLNVCEASSAGEFTMDTFDGASSSSLALLYSTSRRFLLVTRDDEADDDDDWVVWSMLIGTASGAANNSSGSHLIRPSFSTESSSSLFRVKIV